MALSGESSTVDLASETTKRDNDRGTTEVNMAAVLQGLQTTLAHLAKNSELQTEAIQNLKEEFLLCSGDDDTEDISAMDDLGLVAQKKPNCGFGFPAGSGTLVTRNIGPDQIGGQIGERHQ